MLLVAHRPVPLPTATYPLKVGSSGTTSRWLATLYCLPTRSRKACMQCHSVLSLRDRKICRERATTIADRQAGRQAGSGVASKRVSDSMKIYDQQARDWGGGGGGRKTQWQEKGREVTTHIRVSLIAWLWIPKGDTSYVSSWPLQGCPWSS